MKNIEMILMMLPFKKYIAIFEKPIGEMKKIEKIVCHEIHTVGLIKLKLQFDCSNS